MTERQHPHPVVSVRGIEKTFGHVRALRGADLDLFAGEIVGLVGDNGAGKSTLIKILSGSARRDSGTVVVDGVPVQLRTPRAARARGIETVFQDLALAPDLNAWQNLFLGRELRRGGPLAVLSDRAMRRRAPELLGELRGRLPSLDVPVSDLSGGQRQLVAVARAMSWATRVLLLDEPTAALGVAQTEEIFRSVRELAEQRGLAVLLISHNLPEVLTVVDRVVVMRLGRVVATLDPSCVGPVELLGAMAGFSASAEASP